MPDHSTAPDLKATPGDLARWAFWVQLRKLMPADKPGRMAAMCRLWPLQKLTSGDGMKLMMDEYKRCFPDADPRALAADAYRVAFRVHAEELLLSTVDEKTNTSYMRWEGLENLEKARSYGKGVLLLYPHSGNFMMMIAALSLQGYKYTQFAARGLAPDDVEIEIVNGVGQRLEFQVPAQAPRRRDILADALAQVARLGGGDVAHFD